MPKANLRLQNINLTEVKSVKMLVLLHPQGLQIHRGKKTQLHPRLFHSQAVSQLEVGRVRQYRCNS